MHKCLGSEAASSHKSTSHCCLSLDTKPTCIHQDSIGEVCPQCNHFQIIWITKELSHLYWNLIRLFKNVMVLWKHGDNVCKFMTSLECTRVIFITLLYGRFVMLGTKLRSFSQVVLVCLSLRLSLFYSGQVNSKLKCTIKEGDYGKIVAR